METNHEPNKHLTYEEREFIEIGLTTIQSLQMMNMKKCFHHQEC